jgi:hypothetical protein
MTHYTGTGRNAYSLKGLSLNLSTREIAEGGRALAEQRAVGSPPPSRKAALRTALLTAIRAIDAHDDDLPEVLRHLRVRLDEGDHDETAAMSAQYRTNGTMVEFRPLRR